MSVAKNSLDNTGNSNDAIDWDDMVYHPAFGADIDPKAGLHPATEALQALKYESEDSDANARSYKEEGNYYYKGKDFSKAILSYTGGLRAKSSDSKLNAILYTNRAVCHFYLKNYRSCIRDSYVKGIEACLALSKIDEALELSSTGLNILPSSPELLDVQYKVLKKQMELDKEVEQRSRLDCRKENDMNTEYEILKSRGIDVNLKLKPIDMPEVGCSTFYVDSLGKFHWPILFMYPEFGQTDFLRDVIESSMIIDCLKLVFDVNQPPPPWDPKRLYSLEDDAIEVYFEHDIMKKFILCSPQCTIKKLTKQNGFSVGRDLLIILHVISKRSTHFYSSWKDEKI
ncbi:unnamed protein product [Schistosoma mattheei]|uniref:Cns1/TTC4 wheel domain-containing protein n=1 Tax=Schistosoma mattheei TaxID=31246 RepID=A0AA85AUY6_9TREM|nr:unnamed protein product [Schistosoma mattheei]